MFELAKYIDAQRVLVDAALAARLPDGATRPAVLHQAMRYPVLAGGKRLRPILCLAAAEAVGGDAASAMPAALALELLHTYTLVHDDLPCMDNDTLRRGRPTTHVVFGEANALLAGDALLTLAFEWAADVAVPPPYPPGQLVRELALGAGSQGVVGGQIEDLAAEGAIPDAKRLDYIHSHKTGALIRAAVRMGAIAGGAAPETLEALTRYGEAAGLAFQVADDLLNATSTVEQLGKPVGSDAERHKLTYVSVHGLECARRRARELAVEAVLAVKPLGTRAEPLSALARYAVERVK